MAERAGFEPSIGFHLYTLSRRAPSTTRPPLLSSRPRRVACRQSITIGGHYNQRRRQCKRSGISDPRQTTLGLHNSDELYGYACGRSVVAVANQATPSDLPMFRFLLRLIGLLLLAGAFAALVVDGTRSIAAGALALTSARADARVALAAEIRRAETSIAAACAAFRLGPADRPSFDRADMDRCRGAWRAGPACHAKAAAEDRLFEPRIGAALILECGLAQGVQLLRKTLQAFFKNCRKRRALRGDSESAR